MDEVALFRVRTSMIGLLLRERGYDGLLITRPDNFAMATGGKRNYIYTHSDVGSNALFVDREGEASFVGNTIEEPRLMEEELGVLGCQAKSYLWFEDSAARVVEREFGGALVSDDGSLGKNIHGELAILRGLLTATELDKYRLLGRLAAESMTVTLKSVKAGMLEADIAARLVAEGARRRCQVPVALVAADERIAKYRHPLPTVAPLLGGQLQERGVSNYVMVVGCFQREGLVVSMTRFVRTGELPAGIDHAYDRICGVDALMQEATVPGKTLGEVFRACQEGYVTLGFPENEWHNHHQGGATGYAGRTCKGTPGEPFPVLDVSWQFKLRSETGLDVPFGAAFAWNPSAKGVKSEDTFLLMPDGTQEMVTKTPELPPVDVSCVLGRATKVEKFGIFSA